MILALTTFAFAAGAGFTGGTEAVLAPGAFGAARLADHRPVRCPTN